MGRNGSGKSSLLWALQGCGPRTLGHGRRRRRATRPTLEPPAGARWSGWCRRAPPTCSTSRPSTRSARPPTAAPAAAAQLLDRLVPGIPGDRHPRDLSEGQRLALALALVLAARPPVVLLDEPTRGLDYAAKRVLAGILRGLADDGRPVLVATHDVEFVAPVADDVVVLAEGEVVSSGPVRRVRRRVAGVRAPGHKVLGPPWLRVDEVVAARPRS